MTIRLISLLFFYMFGCSRQPPHVEEPTAVVANPTAEGVAITSPAAGEVIRADVYRAFKAAFTTLSDDAELWVFVSDPIGMFYMQYPLVAADRSLKTLTHANVCMLEAEGSWTIWLCMAARRSEASEQLHAQARRNIGTATWAGLPSLPAGLEVLAKVIVERRS